MVESGDLAGMLSAIVIVALCVGLPVMLHYRTKMLALKVSQGASPGEVQGLWDTARRLESRVGYLETVLDTEVPGWRSRSGTR